MLSRLLVGVLIGATAIPGPATAAPAAPASPRAEPAAATITLITGDAVALTRAGKRYAATVRPAPGRQGVTFHTIETDGGLRVLPSDAIPMVDAGRLDAELFDVEHLVAQGYGDAASTTLPLIVQGGAARRTADARALTSIGASAIAPAKDTLAGFWQTLPARPYRGRVANLARRQGPGQAGPQRRADRRPAGVAGRPRRPRRQGRRAGHRRRRRPTPTWPARSSRRATSATARTPSTATGTAPTSPPPSPAPAPRPAAAARASRTARDLLVGKVLDDNGAGYESQIIAGMQWAVASGAKVVSMSLGGDPTDGTDPMSRRSTSSAPHSGALFVVAAGNAGARRPRSARRAPPRSALTVGAVDRADRLADFSSRGPRLGDLGLKPEITAPGVGIVAARAAGTAMGSPVDDHYTAASGTSMATPHVAGAAAMLAQQHPDWTGAKLKDALVSTARTAPDLPVYAQGAGRVDVARATAQAVTGTGVADFGLHAVGGTPSGPPGP